MCFFCCVHFLKCRLHATAGVNYWHYKRAEKTPKTPDLQWCSPGLGFPPEITKYPGLCKFPPRKWMKFCEFVAKNNVNFWNSRFDRSRADEGNQNHAATLRIILDRFSNIFVSPLIGCLLQRWSFSIALIFRHFPKKMCGLWCGFFEHRVPGKKQLCFCHGLSSIIIVFHGLSSIYPFPIFIPLKKHGRFLVPPFSDRRWLSLFSCLKLATLGRMPSGHHPSQDLGDQQQQL